MTLRAPLVALAVLFACGACHLRPLLHPAYATAANFRDVLRVVKFAPASATPHVEFTEDLANASRDWLHKGYIRVGTVNFRFNAEVPKSWLSDQGEAARADVVLATNIYLGPFQTTAPSPFGDTLIPVTRHRYRVQAQFLRKVDRAVLAVQAEELTNEDRFDLQRFGGAKIVAVTERSPAEHAGLRSGDVIISAAGRPVQNVRDLLRAQVELAGQPVALEILRDGRPLQVAVPFQAL